MQTSSYIISHGDIKYSTGNRVNSVRTMYSDRWLLDFF